MRILVTGRDGQVAASLREAAETAGDVAVIALGRPELDLAEPQSVMREVAAAEADIVVSAAAYTAVDQAEDEPARAEAVNVRGAEAVAAAAAAAGLPIVHLSTDYVFAGTSDRPYVETDPTGPQGVYGRTKLVGEQAVAAANPRHVILRTAWVYSPFGKNFVKTMLRLAVDRDEVAVVSDQWGNPTAAADIADGILCIARRLAFDPTVDGYGVFHLAGSGATNWSGFAEEIMRASKALGGPWSRVRAITTEDYPTKARRPANSRLSTEKLDRCYGWRAPPWQHSLARVVNRLVGARS
ncbi:dTDP-4-dehydrorhamnose reductase [Consotaella aegiceratis]|uniref:dTDP-4-dehydrorhamnose reductase n=1 Tax=Consotaella aegiceratis TaxID=3097961 RepID=UPI002F413EBD